MTTNTEPTEAVTVNVEALWVLQAMLDIPTLPPELRSLPYGAARSRDWLSSEPRVEALQHSGLVGPDRSVIAPIARRLHTLAVPDVEIAIVISRGEIRWPKPIDVDDPETWKLTAPEDQLAVVLARRDGSWASGVRAGEHITVDDVDGAAGFAWVADILTGLLDAFAPGEPSRLVAMNLPLDELRTAAEHRTHLGAEHGAARDVPLRALGIPPAAVTELAALLDDPVAEAVVYARAHTDASVLSSDCALNVRATPSGRVVSYQMPVRAGSTQSWMTFAPATPTQVAQGLQAMLGSLHVFDWAQHRRMG